MDPLSEVLSMLKPRSYITAGFDAGGAWALTLDDLAGRIKCYAVMQGACWLSMKDMEAPVLLQAGDCFVLPSGKAVRIGSDLSTEPKRASEVLDPSRSGEIVTYNGGGDVFLVGSRFEVNGRHAEALLQTLPPLMRVETSADRARLRWSVELMMEELQEARPGSSLVAQQLAHMMLVQALRLYLSEQSSNDIGWFAALEDPQLSKALRAMHANPAHSWTVQELATQAGMSRSTFAERFRHKAGETPIAYLTRWRMMLAGEQLTHGRDTLARIALSVGYESEHAFNTAFKRVMGISPGRYIKATW
ncbi:MULTISPECIES: AraC family transcriptional regulator [Halomonadaceae]|uniref:RCS-specific HTH-type transcriptional activator RclR n=1 Tax=Vreelandella titanicae TaxID=664683 RepID=A0AAP9NRL6_9GAMM|nr:MULTISPECIES: AraC family transcriptional regulator [Halomonas]QKS27239.1 RCS-specific HTH-type transcriptional activator RclR [Halomonas titanicae]CDG51204.1 putative AraC-like transcription regulator [Halomonas sp. A3H3]SDJ03432.1 AraC-type DNA-binding protein [Halomonas titanicae]